jgi:hypothetical protein
MNIHEVERLGSAVMMLNEACPTRTAIGAELFAPLGERNYTHC